MKDVDTVKKEMLQKKKWAVIGVTPDESRYGYKIFKKLKEKGYIAYGINPKYTEVEGEKIYASIKDLPEKVECVNIIVNPKITLNVLEEIAKAEIKYVWFQPGTFDEEVLDKAEENNLDIVYYDCVYVELGKL